MTAPVNPEGQTARDVIKAAKRLVEGKYPHWTMAGGENDCSHGYAAGIPCERCDTRLVREFDAAQPSEGQTAQEVRRAALEEAALFVEKHQHPMWTRFAVAQTIRALASTPSPIQTQSTKEEAHGSEGEVSREQHQGAAPATRYLLTAAWKDGALTRMEGPREALDDMLKWWSQNGEPVTTFIEPATAQPDARDAEIAQLKSKGYALRGEAARLTKELEEARAAHQETRDERDTIKDEFDQLALAHYGSEAKALLEALRDLFWDNFPRGVLITRAVCTAPEWRAYQLLAPPEPKAETPAETAGQKEGP